ncbi:MAG: hypothetical protein HY752_08475 [Nitrospirae bacterium]|nr:hypothetical protein [Nitrospirota bacterium]
MAKKIAVLIRDRQGEGLRMGVGLTLADDAIDVYVLDREVERNENNDLNLETMKDIGVNVYTNYKGNTDLEYFSTEEIAKKLLEYNHIIPY